MKMNMKMNMKMHTVFKEKKRSTSNKVFCKLLLKVGLGIPLLTSMLAGCLNKSISPVNSSDVKFDGKVLIIGAGAAGLTAGHILKQQNIPFQIIEASPGFGGRIKKNEQLADFPIDVGAEWIHTDPKILNEILNDPKVNMDLEVVPYSPQSIYGIVDNKLAQDTEFAKTYSEYKFKRDTWFDFFERFIVPGIEQNITYNTPVTGIDYSGEKVLVKTINGQSFSGDKVIVTVPVSILQEGSINFNPALPPEKNDALEQLYMPDALKVFIKFSEKFYPDMLYAGDPEAGEYDENGDKLFYDAAFNKDSNDNILGFFTTGDYASDYVHLTEEEMLNKILAELDALYDGKASQLYESHVFHNWSMEPFIQGSYAHYLDYSVVEEMARPINNKVYFAGEGYNTDMYTGTSTVHAAAKSAYTAVEDILTITESK
ncbi:FAD-dependent oxidoreductase [Thalassomonas viridans]|uniref:Tryptophan 2-monooxygenase n=1 Tax=Thalassomonas viridans TaxID=137584 RepID=A0AAE9Z8T0_9GAMM|nr:NAD(P)/FAD-dependent oxidoreductase [Thalassomonas viridans]WDE08796.1 FAD-dependent oxidoreductase [Thalassomonas viridans]